MLVKAACQKYQDAIEEDKKKNEKRMSFSGVQILR